MYSKKRKIKKPYRSSAVVMVVFCVLGTVQFCRHGFCMGWGADWLNSESRLAEKYCIILVVSLS